MANIEYKVYQSPQTLGEGTTYYGLVLNKGVDSLSSLREIMAYKKITAYEPAQLRALFDAVIQGAMELTALDGNPRSVGNLIRTHLAFDASFPNLDTDPRTIGMNVRLRTLKDLKIPVDTSNFLFVPPSDVTWPRIDRIFSQGASTAGDKDVVVKGQPFVAQGFNLGALQAEGANWNVQMQDGESITSLDFTSNYFRAQFAWNAALDSVSPGTVLVLEHQAQVPYGNTSVLFTTQRKFTLVAGE